MKKRIRDIIEINEELCNGCGQCILDCAEGAIALVDGKARVIADKYCDGLGVCLSGCPTGALRIIRREADAYDEEAVEKHLAGQGRTLHKEHGGHDAGQSCGSSPEGTLGQGCKGTMPQIFAPLTGTAAGASGSGGCPGSVAGKLAGGGGQANTHWPLKLRLMPLAAPFLRGADILLAADCAAFAAPDFHRLKEGRVVLIACPKFEGMEALAERLEAVFRLSKPASCTVARMEVPCCQGLIRACRAAAKASGENVPVRELVITRRGETTGPDCRAIG